MIQHKSALLAQRQFTPVVQAVELRVLEGVEAEASTYLPYPALRPLTELLNIWPPDISSVPDIPGIKQGSLERFDFQDLAQLGTVA